MNEINPCPRCDSEASAGNDSLGTQSSSFKYWVKCINCNLRTPKCEDKQEAINYWNNGKNLVYMDEKGNECEFTLDKSKSE